MLDAPFAPRLLNQDAAHRLGRGTQEMTATLPGLFRAANQAKICLMDQRGRLQGLARLLLGHFLGGKLAQFIVDQRQKLLGGFRIALLDGAQDVRNVAHNGLPC